MRVKGQYFLVALLVLLISSNSRLYCLDLESGEELWNFETKGRIRTSPVVWGKYVLGASEDRYLYAFAQSNGLSVE